MQRTDARCASEWRCRSAGSVDPPTVASIGRHRCESDRAPDTGSHPLAGYREPMTIGDLRPATTNGQVSAAGGSRHRVVIVGGGFGGLYAARALRRAPAAVTLIDRQNHHVFSPLLYQVATAQLAPGEIAQPLRSLLRNQSNTQVLLGEAVDLDPAGHTVALADGAIDPYDSLDRRDRHATQLVRPCGLGTPRTRSQDHRRRPGDPTADPAGLRARRARGRCRGPESVDDIRGRRWRTDRGGAGGCPRRGRARRIAPRVPGHRSDHGAHRPGGGARPHPADLSPDLSRRAAADLADSARPR